MAVEIGIQTQPFNTLEHLKEYTLVTLNANGEVIPTSVAGVHAGVVVENIDESTVKVQFISNWAYTSGAVVIGDTLSIGANGTVIKSTDGAIIGVARMAGATSTLIQYMRGI